MLGEGVERQMKKSLSRNSSENEIIGQWGVWERNLSVSLFFLNEKDKSLYKVGGGAS